MSKRIPLILGSVVLMLAIGAGSFYGGVLYQQRQIAAIRTSFFAGRGGDGGGTGGGGGGYGGFFGAGGGGGGGAGRGQFGTIKSIDGDTLTVSTPQSEVKVKLTATTQIEKIVAGTTSDLAVGDRIVVRGQADSSGTVTANNVQVTVAQAPSQ